MTDDRYVLIKRTEERVIGGVNGIRVPLSEVNIHEKS